MPLAFVSLDLLLASLCWRGFSFFDLGSVLFFLCFKLFSFTNGLFAEFMELFKHNVMAAQAPELLFCSSLSIMVCHCSSQEFQHVLPFFERWLSQPDSLLH